jgi:hypothetical protein
MRRNILLILLLASAFLALTAEDCIVDEKTVEIPVNGDAGFTMLAIANEGDSPDAEGSATFDLTGEMFRLENEGMNEYELKTARVQSGWWEVLSFNRGSDNLTFSGSVRVTRVETGDSADLLTWSSVNVRSLVGERTPVPDLNGDGVALLNQGAQDYLDNRFNAPPITFRFDWTGTASEVPYRFTWTGAVRFTVTGLLKVDVPDP